MFRRSRFSVRPNVSTAGRTAAAPQEAPPVNQRASETPKDVSESSPAIAATDSESVVTPSEKDTAKGDGTDQNGESTSSSAAVQRRKRFTVKPKVAPGRLSALPRTPKSPVKTVPEIPVEVASSDLDKPTNQTAAPTAAPQGFRSPRRRRPSEATSTPILSEGSAPSAVPPTEDSSKQTHLPKDKSGQLENTSGSQAKEAPSRLPDKVPSSLPEKETIEISERAKTLVSSKCRLSMSPAALSLSRLLNDSSDLQRLAKARKLRELIREEMHKEKKIKKAKLQAKEFTLDPAKMTMRDLIHYLPVSNPMTSSLEEPALENEFVVPASLGREESPEKAQEPEAPPKIASPREEEEEEEAAEEEEGAAEEEQEEASLVPQVKVAEDGSLIIDEESLTVEVQRAKGPNPAEGRDPIFERGSTTTYSSFRKTTYSKPWFSEETDMFFLAISMVGTDFSMICQLFPHRARSEIKNKFKKEERENSWRIDKAFRERRKLDIEYFSKLLEKILEVQKNRKKLKSFAEKNPPKKHKRKTKGKTAVKKSEMTDLEEEEGETENADLFDEEETAVSKPNQKCKRKNTEDGSNEEPESKKNKMGPKSSQQDEACIPEDTEAALPEDRANSDMSENTENLNAAKETVIKPAELSRGRAPKPLLPLGKKWGKKPSLPSSEAKVMASDKGGDNVSDGASEEQVKKDASPLRQVNESQSANDDISSEDEDDAVQPPKPTRYGRMPKPTKPLTYPAKADTRSAASETPPASAAGSTAPDVQPKPKSATKRRGSSKTQSESKRPKLVTLRASQSEDSDDENEKHWEEEEVEEEQLAFCSSGDGVAPAFVPASLRSPHPVIPEVEETMEELDILVSMPDVMGISQDALWPDVSCKLAQNETGTAEPCEHQRELLVDVIDFLSTEVTDDDRYNEAAQTLLTMGTLAEFAQSAQNQTATQEHPTGKTSVCGNKTSQRLEEEIASKPATQKDNSVTHFMPAASVQDEETSEIVATVELLNSTAEVDGMLMTETSDQRTGSDMDLTPQLQAIPERADGKPPQTRRGRLSKVKPKPNLGRPHSKSQSMKSTGRTAEESHTAASSLLQATDSLLAEEISKVSDSSQNLPLDEIPCNEVKLTEKPSGSQESADQLQSGAALSCLNTSENQSQCFSDTKLQPSVEQATRDTTRESTDEMLSDTAVTQLQGTDIDSALVQQSSDHPGQCLTPVDDLPVSEKEESNTSTHQVKKSLFQKVKPNLAQTSRGLHPETQTTREAFEKNANLTPNPKLDEKITVNVEADQANIEFPAAPSQITDHVLDDLTPSLDVFSTRTPTEELSATEEQKSHVGVVCQVESGTLTLHQETSESQNLPETQHVPSREQAHGDMMPTSDSTEENPVSCVGATESSRGNVVTSNSAIPERVVHVANIDSTSVQESDQPVPRITHEKEREVTSNCQVRSGQKVKPKPNLPQASRRMRSKPQTTKDNFEKDSNPTLNLTVHEKTTVNNEAESACITSPVSDLTPLLDVSSTIMPIDKLSTIVDTKTDVGVVGQAEPGAAMSDQSHPEHQNVSVAQSDPSREQATKDTGPTSEPTEGNLSQATESSCYNLLKSDSAVPESEEIPVSHEEQREVASTCHMGRGQNLKTKLILTQTSRSVQSTPQTTKETAGHNTQLLEKPSSPTSRLESANNAIADVEARSSGNPSQIRSIDTASVLAPSLELAPTEELTSTGGQKVDVGSAPDSTSEGSEQKVPQRRQRFSKIKPKPNLGSSTRNKRTKLIKSSEQCLTEISSDKTSRQQPVVNNDAPTQLQPAEKDGKHLTSTQYSLHTELLLPTVVGPSADKDMSSDGVSLVTSSVAETQSVLTESVVENKSIETHPSAGESTEDKVEAGPASQRDHQQDMSATETNTLPTDDPTAMLDAQSLEGGSVETHIKSAQTQSTADPNESTQQPCSSNDSETQSQDANQRSETSESNQVASQSTDDNEAEPTGSSKSSRKNPQIRRGRLIKPKPNLGHKSQPRHVQNKKQAGADSGSLLESVDASVSHKSVSEGQLKIQEPAEGAVNQNSPANDAGSSQGCSTQAPDNSSQHGSISSTGGIQISKFSDMLLDQAPSDPDEPFFILSLTEIPVSSLGPVEESASDFFPSLPVVDASVQRQSCGHAEDLATVGDEPSNTSTEEISEAGIINVKDTGLDRAADSGSIMENPVDPHESAAVQPLRLPETDAETEHSPTKKRSMGTAGSEDKLQVEPKTQRMKQASKTPSAAEVEPIPTEESELPGPSVQPEASDEVITDAQKGSIDHLDIKKTLTSGTDPMDSNSGAQTAQTKRDSSRKRKPRGVTSSSSETNNDAPSTSCEVAPTPSPTQLSEEIHLTPSSPTQAEVEQTSEHSLLLFSDQSLSTSLCTAEFSSSQPREGVEGSSVEEEPISVSQYFISDIFTEVEEG